MDKIVHVWDLTTGLRIRSIPFAYDVWSVGFLEQGRRILIVDASCTVCIRDVDSAPRGAEIRTYKFGDPLTRKRLRNAICSPDFQHAAMAFEEGALRIVSVESGAVVHELPKQRSGSVGGLAFSADGKWLATCVFGDPEVNVWNVRTGERLKTLSPKTGGAD